MDKVFRLESVRTISDDWVVRYENRFFQLEALSRRYAPAKGRVMVCEARDGRLMIEYRGRALRWQEIPSPAKPRGEQAMAPGTSGLVQAPPRAKRKWVPPADHPWRMAARRLVERKVRGGNPVSPPDRSIREAWVFRLCPLNTLAPGRGISTLAIPGS